MRTAPLLVPLLSVLPARATAGDPPDGDPPGYSPYRKLDLLARALAQVENHWVDAPDERSVAYGAIRGMVGALDPFSAFLTPEQARQVREDARGSFAGVGLEVEQRGGRLVVVAPMDGTPAARAGLAPGDVIERVDGRPIGGADLHETVARLRGPPGTGVTLTVRPSGADAPRDLVLVRERIAIEDVRGRLVGAGVAIVRVRLFQEGTAGRVREAIERLREQAGAAPRGLVLDLRNNPGGLLDEAVRTADLFLARGRIVRTVGKGGRVLEEASAGAHGPAEDVPMAVLVNGGSASAAEIVAGALRDHGRARLVGERTFGKGSVQTLLPLGDGSALKLTVARYATPAGRPIDGTGIAPDVEVAGAGAAASPGAQPDPAPGADPALDAAVALLAGPSPAPPPAAQPRGAQDLHRRR